MSVIFEAADLFAGCGGTSTGLLRAVEASGMLARLVAVNHWPLAVATHRANHGGHAHYCMDLALAEPEDLVPGGRLDLLVASPECTQFSRARGGKPVNDQRRAGADWVIRWLERLDVTCLLIENVEEFMSWGDVDDRGVPIKRKNGRLFLAWLARIRALGYALDFKILNAADYGDVTTRKRFFLIARKDGRPIRWPTPTHCKGGKTDVFGTIPPWQAAREIIDWSDLGESMLDRAKPLSLKTRLRIARGAQRFFGVLAPLYIRLLDLPAEDEAKYIAGCTGVVAAAFVAPNTENAVPKSTGEPFGTFTTIPGIYVATPTAEPFVFANRENNVPVGPDQPIPGLTTATGGGAYVVTPEAQPFVIGQQSDSAARDTGQPIMTIPTGGVLRLFSPTAAPFLDLYYQTGVADSVDEPFSTVTTKPRHALVSPLVVPYGPRAEARSADADPLHAVLTKDRLGVAVPIASVITPGFGENLGKGQHPRVHSIDEPTPAIAATGHLHLATATVEQLRVAIRSIDPRRLVFIDGVLHALDIRFRMLKNGELAAAMGFPPDYRFHGTKSDVTRQIGNAVAVNLAAALVGAILDPEGKLSEASA